MAHPDLHGLSSLEDFAAVFNLKAGLENRSDMNEEDLNSQADILVRRTTIYSTPGCL